MNWISPTMYYGGKNMQRSFLARLTGSNTTESQPSDHSGAAILERAVANAAQKLTQLVRYLQNRKRFKAAELKKERELLTQMDIDYSLWLHIVNGNHSDDDKAAQLLSHLTAKGIEWETNLR